VTVRVRAGSADDVAAALAVFERSNLARRRGDWPHRVASVARIGGHLNDPASWLLVAEDAQECIAMTSAEPLRGDDGAGPVDPRGCFLGYLFVVPERWGEGIGGALLDAVVAEATRRGSTVMRLWTHEDNERSHRLYRSRGFSPTGRTTDGEGEWEREL